MNTIMYDPTQEIKSKNQHMEFSFEEWEKSASKISKCLEKIAQNEIFLRELISDLYGIYGEKVGTIQESNAIRKNIKDCLDQMLIYRLAISRFVRVNISLNDDGRVA